MTKSETITTRAPNAGKKTPAKASHSTTAKAKPAGTARKATSSKKDSSKKKPTASKKKPFCVVVRPEGTGLAQHVGYFATPVEAAVAYARVMALHGRTVEDLRQEAFDALQRSLGRPVEPVVAELDGVRLHLSKSTCTCQKCGDLHSPYEGVSWSCTKSSRQQAAGTDIPEQPYIVKVDGARLGSFATATEAAACYAAMSAARDLWHEVPGRAKDYVSRPKASGYQALHSTFVVEGMSVELQIRGAGMHAAAEHGAARGSHRGSAGGSVPSAR